jgi:3-phenylpropionate/trans-cinnamate dioxygenase ferredoxin component
MDGKDKISGLRAADVPAGTCRKAYVNGKEIAVFNVGGQFYATQSNCTHAGGPLCDGSLAGEIVTCPWHGSQFNVRTGEVVQDPAEEPIATYPIEVEDGVLVAG